VCSVFPDHGCCRDRRLLRDNDCSNRLTKPRRDHRLRTGGRRADRKRQTERAEEEMRSHRSTPLLCRLNTNIGTRATKPTLIGPGLFLIKSVSGNFAGVEISEVSTRSVLASAFSFSGHASRAQISVNELEIALTSHPSFALDRLSRLNQKWAVRSCGFRWSSISSA